MAWFRVDDGFASSPKVLRIPRAQRLAAVGLWTIAGAWSSQHLTDGVVPNFMLEEWGADVSHGTALVDAGLWVPTADGYRFHDWLDYQSSRADVRALREKERTRKEEWRRKKAEKSGESPDNVPGMSQGDDTSSGRLPIPAHPSPSQPSRVKEGGAARGTRIPEPFMVTLDMRTWAAEKTPLVNVDASTAKFCDFWRAKSGKDATKRDWVATWRNWLRSDQERAMERGGKASKDVRALSVVEMGRELAGIETPQAVTA